jgi:hypothetical protein
MDGMSEREQSSAEQIRGMRIDEQGVAIKSLCIKVQKYRL